MTSAAIVPKAGLLPPLSDLQIAEGQQETEQTPSEPILPPKPSGNYEVDESVIACKVDFVMVAEDC